MDPSPKPEERRSLLRPAIGTIVFTLTVPLPVIGLVPYLLSGWKVEAPLFGGTGVRWVGVVLFVCAAPVFVNFLVRFVGNGLGTPAPIAPTRYLVVTGPFRYVRNPGYIAVVSMILGQGLFLGSVAILVYAALLALGFHLFVLFYEEPTLRRQFGAQYESYCRQVPRWMPRLRRHRQGDG